MNLQRFVPSFIKRLDQYLLIHYPIIWQSRIHNVFYATFLTNLLFAILAYLMPLGLSDKHDIISWIWTFFVLSITYLVIWLVHAGRFNLFKHYGKRPIGDEYLNFVLSFLCMAMISSVMFTFPYFYSLKIKNLVSDTELASDINALNLGSAFFPKNQYAYSKFDSENNTTTSSEIIHLYDFNRFDEFNYNRYKDYFANWVIENDQSSAAEESMVDSVQNQILPEKNIGINGLYSISYSKKLFNEKKGRSSQLALINQFIATAHKYGIEVPKDANYHLNKFNAQDGYSFDFRNSLPEDIQFLNDLERKIGDVIGYKTGRILFQEKDFWHFMWYAIFYSTLVFLIYRNNRRDDFIKSVITGISILVITGIYFGISGNNDEKDVFNLYFLIYAIACFGSIAIIFKSSRSWINAACLNLVVLVTPFMPLYLYEVHIRPHSHAIALNYELAGFVIFFALLQPFFKKMYATHWALPEG